IRVLGSSKQLAPDKPAKVALERELVEWHLRNRDMVAAQQACANWLHLAPDDDIALEQLQELSQNTEDFAHLARSLVLAAAESSDPHRRMQLLVRAAET